MTHLFVVFLPKALRLLVVTSAIQSFLACSSSNSSNGGTGGVMSGGGSGTGGTQALGGTTANGGQSSVTSPATFTEVYAIISASCLPCHSTGAGKTVGMLDMSSRATAYESLLGTNGTGAAAAGSGCAASGLLRVAPDDSANSLIWQKVNSNLQGTAAPCGIPMPAGSAALPKADVDMIATWIDDGARNN